jgi:hypothetical protein
MINTVTSIKIKFLQEEFCRMNLKQSSGDAWLGSRLIQLLINLESFA